MAEKNISKTRMLTEAAIMLAFATTLSIVKILELPYGGSVTVACMLPIIIIAYRHGVKFGLITAFVFGVIQQIIGLKTLSYVTTWQSVVAVIALDYIIAFTVIGLGGVFRKMSSQANGLMLGTLLVCALRFICHVISGATVWAGLSIPTNAALIYSIGYNATYMVPETIVTASAAYYIGSILDFRGDYITNLKKEGKAGIPVLNWISGLIIVGAIIFVAVNVFMHLQNGESGEFDATGFASVNWRLVGIVTVSSIVVAAILLCISNRKKAPAAKAA
ncbi:MAG: energy-coupled thiamine transporter ThiT [Clostridiales bacterium]|nr:energy-coupled thiamine transporter ThiT [Clostridiales bacterium]